MPSSKITLEWHGEKVSKRIRDEATLRVTRAGEHLRTSVLETLSGSRHGRRYRVPGTRRFYTASAPGEPPAVRLGRLRQSIRAKVEKRRAEVSSSVGTDLDYGDYLERGTSRMAPRPWLKRTFDEQQDELERIITEKWTL